MEYGLYGQQTPKLSQNQMYHCLRFLLSLNHESLILLLILNFSIFLFKILKLASQLNLAAVLLIGFLNFEFGAILGPYIVHL